MPGIKVLIRGVAARAEIQHIICEKLKTAVAGTGFAKKFGGATCQKLNSPKTDIAITIGEFTDNAVDYKKNDLVEIINATLRGIKIAKLNYVIEVTYDSEEKGGDHEKKPNGHVGNGTPSNAQISQIPLSKIITLRGRELDEVYQDRKLEIVGELETKLNERKAEIDLKEYSLATRICDLEAGEKKLARDVAQLRGDSAALARTQLVIDVEQRNINEERKKLDGEKAGIGAITSAYDEKLKRKDIEIQKKEEVLKRLGCELNPVKERCERLVEERQELDRSVEQKSRELEERIVKIGELRREVAALQSVPSLDVALSRFLLAKGDVYSRLGQLLINFEEDFDPNETRDAYVARHIGGIDTKTSLAEIRATSAKKFDETDYHKTHHEAYTSSLKRKKLREIIAVGTDAQLQDYAPGWLSERNMSIPSDRITKAVLGALLATEPPEKSDTVVITDFENEESGHEAKIGINERISVLEGSYTRQKEQADQILTHFLGEKGLPIVLAYRHCESDHKLTVMLPLPSSQQGTYLANILTQIISAEYIKTKAEGIDIKKSDENGLVSYTVLFDGRLHTKEDVDRFKDCALRSMIEQHEKFPLSRIGFGLQIFYWEFQDKMRADCVEKKYDKNGFKREEK